MSGAPIQVWIDEDIAELIPGYMQRRKEDLGNILGAVKDKAFDRIEYIGHSMKGSGGGYGLPSISEIGRELERHAARGDIDCILTCLDQLEYYLDNLEILVRPCER